MMKISEPGLAIFKCSLAYINSEKGEMDPFLISCYFSKVDFDHCSLKEPNYKLVNWLMLNVYCMNVHC